MPCCILLLLIGGLPRLAIVLVWLFSDYLHRAYEGVLLPILGFLFLPYTTLAYAWAMNSRGSVDGIHLVAVIVAVLIDLGHLFGGARRRRAPAD